MSSVSSWKLITGIISKYIFMNLLGAIKNLNWAVSNLAALLCNIGRIRRSQIVLLLLKLVGAIQMNFQRNVFDILYRIIWFSISTWHLKTGDDLTTHYAVAEKTASTKNSSRLICYCRMFLHSAKAVWRDKVGLVSWALS